MLRFFKVNDPFRLIGVALYLLVFSVVYLVLFPFPITEPLLQWMVLGERLGEGFYLYKDVVDDTGPLSSAFFLAMDFLFGRSPLAYAILGRVLILIQLTYWNFTLIRYRVFDENTYLPAIIMAALFHFSFDMLTLSPALLGSTFLILALSQLFSQTVLQKETSESTLLIGIYGGIATGFHLNFGLILPYMIFTGLLISGFSFRQLILSIVGFFLPILLILVFYFWNDSLQDALEILPLVFTYDGFSYQSVYSWLILGAFPVLLALFGYFLGTFQRGSTINQQKQRQVIITWMLFGALVFFFVKKQAGFELLIFLPGFTYLITQFFLYVRKSWIAGMTFTLLILGLPLGALFYWKNQTQSNEIYFVTNNPGNTTENKKIMVLGPEMDLYLENQLGGPFLNYHLSQAYLAKEKDLEGKSRLYSKVFLQKPELIFDSEGEFKKLLLEFPALQSLYSEKSPGIFQRANF
ncbi:hypothetical protein [Algoriphagus taiwanensis]|uniref:Glycosyltransferase RgtA/B/C/D-like domain-containing protein n=1 Tax=Algoriphagus taiwanensis TaxID=1445656 RepID=A0ABQ6Q2B5_9BACT|nr:hypothetical protein Ataiwa_20220 [Algoriphagus taiwanensis]